MLLGVVSDTHGQVTATREGIRMLEGFAPAAVIHCGDIGSAEIVRLFDAWPTHFVLGNVDLGIADELETAIRQAGQSFHGEFGSLELGGRRIAFLHGHDNPRLRRETAVGGWDLLCYGHSHALETHRVDRTVVLNPGALHRARPHSIAVVELTTLEVTLLKL